MEALHRSFGDCRLAFEVLDELRLIYRRSKQKFYVYLFPGPLCDSIVDHVYELVRTVSYYSGIIYISSVRSLGLLPPAQAMRLLFMICSLYMLKSCGERMHTCFTPAWTLNLSDSHWFILAVAGV